MTASQPLSRPQGRRGRRPSLRFAACLALAGLLGAACGGGSAGEPDAPVEAAAAPQADGAQASDPPEDATLVRLAMPPSALWQWLVDSGELERWQQAHGAVIEASAPFRPFAAFVGGHADIILVHALDVPVFAGDGELRPVVFGKHAADRSIVATKRTSQVDDLSAVVEGRIATGNQLGPTLLWGLIAHDMHSLELSDTSRDFELVMATFGIADTVVRGEADACICLPDQSASGLSEGMLRPLYAGERASRLYAEMAGTPELEPLGEVFVAGSEWYEANRPVADAFLALWQLALDHWHEAHRDLIAGYPDLFSVRSDAEIAWLADYVSEHDWIVDSVYLTDADQRGYETAVDRLRAIGLIDSGARSPAVAVARLAPSGASEGGDQS